MYIFMLMKETGVYPSLFRTFRSEKYADVYDKAQGKALLFRGKVIYPEKGKVDYPQKQNMKMNKTLFGTIYGTPKRSFFIFIV